MASPGPGRSSPRVDASPPACSRSGCERGERIGVWSLNRPEWTLTQFAAAEAGLVFVTINPAYRLHELEYALNKVGCAALVVGDRASRPATIIGMVNALPPELASAKPGALKRRRGCRDLRIVIQIGGPPPGHAGLRGGRAAWAARAHRGAGGDCATTMQFDDAVNIQFTSGTTGSPKGVTLTPPQHPQQRLFRRPRDAADGRGPHLHSGAAVSLLRHGDGQSRGRHARRGDGLSRRGLRSAGDAGDRRAGALHGALRRADDVHRRARPSRIRAASICPRCAPASWRARPARSR